MTSENRPRKSRSDRILTRMRFRENEVIFQEGDRALAAYLLKSGAVEIITSNDGEPVVLTTIQPNQLFGELALIDGTPRSATAYATMESEVVVVRPEDIERELDEAGDFMRYWVEYLTERIRDLTKRVMD
ncbi:MAG: Crp/Fnr family transcriptional regulator [Magnetovibrionaceae bacterium]